MGTELELDTIVNEGSTFSITLPFIQQAIEKNTSDSTAHPRPVTHPDFAPN
jgi:hypothetical protein